MKTTLRYIVIALILIASVYLLINIVSRYQKETKDNNSQKIGQAFDNSTGALLNDSTTKAVDNSISNAVSIFTNDSSEKSLKLMIDTYLASKKVDSAIYYLDKYYKDTTKYPSAYIDLINLLINEKEYDKALAISKERITQGYKKSIFTDIFYSWSQYFFKIKDNVGVIRTMEKGLEIEPKNPEVLKYLAESYKNAGLKEKSDYYYKQLSKFSKKQ
ncbi:MAG TPA: hypothetical protein PLE30_09915 [Candidatus Kapabacteria bacterium]|nr:hypothetical protein [Candidatus Kapabacteria bacterium]